MADMVSGYLDTDALRTHQERPELDPIRTQSLDLEAVVEVIFFNGCRAVYTSRNGGLGSSIAVQKRFCCHSTGL